MLAGGGLGCGIRHRAWRRELEVRDQRSEVRRHKRAELMEEWRMMSHWGFWIVDFGCWKWDGLARMFRELLWRDHEDGRATGQPQGAGFEAYLNGTSQDELVLSLPKEHPRTPGRTAISVVAASHS